MDRGACTSDQAATKLPLGIQQDSLSPVMLTLLLPGPEGRERAMEETWIEHTHGLLGKRFSELRPGEAEGWRPSLVYSPMIVEDGRRLPQAVWETPLCPSEEPQNPPLATP